MKTKWHTEEDEAGILWVYHVVREVTDEQDGEVLMVGFDEERQTMAVGHMDIDGNFEPEYLLSLGAGEPDTTQYWLEGGAL